nr:sister chromatid cohesion protein dcc1 [Quercus suber]
MVGRTMRAGEGIGRDQTEMRTKRCKTWLITTQYSLQLKSAERLPGDQSDSSAVLCTPDTTFHLRQVNHSNSVFVTRSPELQKSEVCDNPQPSLEAIAQSSFTLELTRAKDASAHAYLEVAVPLYLGGGGYSGTSRIPLTKSQHFANVPLDQHQCEEAWTEMACFEMRSRVASFQPAPTVRNQAWTAMLTQAVAEGIDLTSRLTTRDVQTLVGLDEDEWPPELCQAILDSMTLPSKDGVLQLDRDRCTRLNGLSLLQEHVNGCVYPVTKFEEKWGDSLPEKWRSKAHLELLEGSYKLTDLGLVYINKINGETSATRDAAGTTSNAAPQHAYRRATGNLSRHGIEIHVVLLAVVRRDHGWPSLHTATSRSEGALSVLEDTLKMMILYTSSCRNICALGEHKSNLYSTIAIRLLLKSFPSSTLHSNMT